MAGRPGGHPLPPRPPLPSHQSNSVPSTPHQHARDFASRSRTPSPHGGLGSHSPQSIASEPHGPMTKLPNGRPTCKYETAAAFSRRRMQYDIGDAPLERPKEEPKKALSPDEEKKLGGDMRELYDRLLPSSDSDKRRLQFVDKLGRILRKEWPGSEFHVHMFGSSGNLLCTSESDVDICIQTPMKKLETMHSLAEALANNGMERVVCVAAARVPIVKIWDPELRLAADVNVNNTLALENTRMIKTYVQIDDRVRPLAMVIKHWTKQRILNDAGTGGTLSSYAWICMILNFLQTRNPPILPALHQLPHKTYIANDGTESGFSDDVESLRGFGNENKETIGELLFHFFRQYAHEIEYDSSVISVRHGRLLTRKEKGWDLTSKEGQWRLCVEEPFNTTRNLGNSADATAFRGIHLEIRHAFDLLAEGGQLEKACEQYQYPPEEKVIFKKPAPVPKPVLSHAIPPRPPRDSRPHGGSSRGGRGGSRATSGVSSRRASSGAAFGRSVQYMQAAQMGLAPYEVLSPPIDAPFSKDAYAHQLWQRYRFLGEQANAVRVQLVQSQARHEALQAQSAATAHAQAVIQGQNQPRPVVNSIQSPPKVPYLGGSPQLPGDVAFAGSYVHANPTKRGKQRELTKLQETSSRTNPSSPSLATAIPARRGMQRTTSQNGSQSGAARSQSQPARAIHTLHYQYQIAYDPNTGLPYYVHVPTGGIPLQENLRPEKFPIPYVPTYPINAMNTNEGLPKEYVGYYFNESPQQQPQVQYSNAPVAPIPSYGELASRRNRSGDLQPLPLNGMRRSSRSPSPLGHARTWSSPLRSAPLPVSPNAGYPQMDPTQFVTDYMLPQNGLRIVGDPYTSASPPESDVDFSRDLARSATLDGSDVPSLEPSFDDDPPRLIPPGAIQFGEALTPVSPQVELPAPSLPNGASPEHAQVLTIVSSSKQPVPLASGPTIVSSADPATPPRTANKGNQEIKHVLPPIDIPTPNPESRKPSGEPKTAPLLSPVLETRTPSPTATRHAEGRRQASIASNGIPSASDDSKSKARANGEVKTPTTRPQTRSRSPQTSVPTSKKEPMPPTPAADQKATPTSATPKSASLLNFAAAAGAVAAGKGEKSQLPIPPTPVASEASTLEKKSDGNSNPSWQTATGTKHGRRRKRRQSTGGASGGAAGSGASSVSASASPEKGRNEKKISVGEERKGG